MRTGGLHGADSEGVVSTCDWDCGRKVSACRALECRGQASRYSAKPPRTVGLEGSWAARGEDWFDPNITALCVSFPLMTQGPKGDEPTRCWVPTTGRDLAWGGRAPLLDRISCFPLASVRRECLPGRFFGLLGGYVVGNSRLCGSTP